MSSNTSEGEENNSLIEFRRKSSTFHKELLQCCKSQIAQKILTNYGPPLGPIHAPTWWEGGCAAKATMHIAFLSTPTLPYDMVTNGNNNYKKRKMEY